MKLTWNTQRETHFAETDSFNATIAKSGRAPHSNRQRYTATIREKGQNYAIVAVDCIVGLQCAKTWVATTIERFNKYGVGPDAGRRHAREMASPRMRPPVRQIGGVRQ